MVEPWDKLKWISIMRFVILFLILLTSNLVAQDIIHDGEIYAGLYKDFLAFRKNEPSKPGVLNFIQKGNGRTTDILLNNDTLSRVELSKDYWGFSKDREIYVNVNKFWLQLGLSTQPEAPFSKVLERGPYFVLWVETTVSASLVGGMVGGLAGALIGSAIDRSSTKSIASQGELDDESGELLVIHHNTGVVSLVTKQSIVFLLAEEPELLTQFQKERKVTKPLMLNYLRQLNELKRSNKGEIIFNEKEHWAILTIVNKTAKNTNKSFDILSNGEYHLTFKENGQHLRDTIPPSVPVRISSPNNNKILIVTPKPKERVYYQVTMDDNDSIFFKQIDYTRAKYLIDAYKAKESKK